MVSITNISDERPSTNGVATLNGDNSNSKDRSRSCEARIFAKSADDEICITGIAGSFPSSRNVAEFEHNLWSKVMPSGRCFNSAELIQFRGFCCYNNLFCWKVVK